MTEGLQRLRKWRTRVIGRCVVAMATRVDLALLMLNKVHAMLHSIQGHSLYLDVDPRGLGISGRVVESEVDAGALPS